MGSIMSEPKIDRVAVIGGGPGGLAAAKYLVAENTFSKIEVFEQRSSVGGVWCATPTETVDVNFTIPRTQPSQIPSIPAWTGPDSHSQFAFVSPVYDSLDTNIPHTLMNYSDQAFPVGSSLFPPHTVVREYLERYADDIRPYLSLGTQVLDISPAGTQGGKWIVAVKDVATGKERKETFDAVVVANGHYDDPYVPSIKGIQEWNAAYPATISHSKFYRRPDEFINKKVIVVGHSASGIDLAAQISTVSQSPLIVSEKRTTSLSPEDLLTMVARPQISELITQDRTVVFEDGHIEKDVDSIIFCTGYMYSFPFLKGLSPPLVTDGTRTRNLYQQIFYYPDPTLSFLGLPQRIVPLPVSESQSAVIARLYSGRLSLPTESKMKAWEDAVVAEKGDSRSFHTLAFPLDAQYINLLHDWALSAKLEPKLPNNGKGKIPPYWGAEQQWVRERFPLIKAASRALGEDRFKITSLKELGFDFEEWRKENERTSSSPDVEEAQFGVRKRISQITSSL